MTVELRPNFVPLHLFYRILKMLFRLDAVEGEDHKFEMIVANRSSIPFDGANLAIKFVIPSVAGSLLAMTEKARKIPRLSAGDMTHLDLGNITMRAAGNGEMTLTLESSTTTQTVFIWYQKLAGSALVNIDISSKSKVTWVMMLLTLLLVLFALLSWLTSTR